MLHSVSYLSITLNLRVKMRQTIIKFADYGTTSLLEQSDNRVYNSTFTEHSASTDLNRSMLVGLTNPRIFAIFSRVVKIRVKKTEYKQILQKFCSKNEIKHELMFAHE